MRAGRLHVAGFNTGSVPLAVACAGFRPFAIMAAADGSHGYELEIITFPGSGLERIEDIRGRTLAFTTETSNSGVKAPSALLQTAFGMVAGIDLTPAISGAHDNSILGVANRDDDAAAIANSVTTRMIDRGVVDAEQLVVIDPSETFPTTGYGTFCNLHPDLQQKVREAFSPSTGTARRSRPSASARASRSSYRSPARKTGASSGRSMPRRACSIPATDHQALMPGQAVRRLPFGHAGTKAPC
jgi:phosphate/phosphite/phosphonate ABC transporter binding protein